MSFRYLLILCFGVFLAACEKKVEPDFVLLNGRIYTVDTTTLWVEALAACEGRIIRLGSTADIQKLIGPATEVIDLEGRFAMPGFIEGHGHFSGLGKSLLQLNFLQSKNWDEIVQMVAAAAQAARPGEWIEGRGWHQEKWDSSPPNAVHGYPHHHELSAQSPYNPVVLRHASGHSLFANKLAMALAGISRETPDPSGGAILRDGHGDPIGVFEERAMDLILQAYQGHLDSLSENERTERWLRGIRLAEQECIRKGVTSFQDAGASVVELGRYKKLAEQDSLDLRLWVMMRDSQHLMERYAPGLPVVNAGGGFYTCRAIKSEVDGALGSYGAWLLAPYNDKPGFTGQNTTPLQKVSAIAALARAHKLQLCVHAIGDRANRETLDLMATQFGESQKMPDHRWRIEHAQHLDPADIPRFKQLGVIAAMQGIHCTSDAPFVVKRLGAERAGAGAYAWRALLDAGAVVGNGTDAPVEDVDPIASFFASVTRQRADNGMLFFPEQKMTREEAIHSYTLANAYAAFEEKEKGSLEIGKYADLVVLTNDLINCAAEDILKTKVWMTIIGGKVKYRQAEK
jgi:hypothetical protein